MHHSLAHGYLPAMSPLRTTTFSPAMSPPRMTPAMTPASSRSLIHTLPEGDSPMAGDSPMPTPSTMAEERDYVPNMHFKASWRHETNVSPLRSRASTVRNMTMGGGEGDARQTEESPKSPLSALFRATLWRNASASVLDAAPASILDAAHSPPRTGTSSKSLSPLAVRHSLSGNAGKNPSPLSLPPGLRQTPTLDIPSPHPLGMAAGAWGARGASSSRAAREGQEEGVELFAAWCSGGGFGDS